MIQVRWMIRRDLPEILQIENESFECKWTEDEFLSALKERNCIGMVAEISEKVIGYMIYSLHKERLELLNFAVSHECRRQYVGSEMIKKLKQKLSSSNRTQIITHVRESNLSAQLFFRFNRFLAIDVLKNFYQDSEEDAYLMSYLES